MVTLVGIQSDFYNAIQSMLELEFDAILAYEAAIDRLQNQDYKRHFEDFKSDHMRHKEVLSAILKDANKDIPTSGDIKQLLTKGKVVLAGLIDDKAILIAMKTNEDDTNKAYERLSTHDNTPDDLRQSITRLLDDERRHRAWIEDTINKFS